MQLHGIVKCTLARARFVCRVPWCRVLGVGGYVVSCVERGCRGFGGYVIPWFKRCAWALRINRHWDGGCKGDGSSWIYGYRGGHSTSRIILRVNRRREPPLIGSWSGRPRRGVGRGLSSSLEVSCTSCHTCNLRKRGYLNVGCGNAHEKLGNGCSVW